MDTQCTSLDICNVGVALMQARQIKYLRPLIELMPFVIEVPGPQIQQRAVGAVGIG